jgi:glycosyltransferase involved in cell wall biosynthesis
VGKVLVHRIGLVTKNPKMADLRKFPLHLNKLLFQYAAYRTAKKLHKMHHYDGIWAMIAHATGVPAGLFKRTFPEVKYILTLQEGDPPEYIERKMRVFGPYFKRGFTSADIVQTISVFLGAWARNMGYHGPLEIIPNGVDTKHFSQEVTEAERQETEKILGKGEGNIFLVTTSRLVRKNGIDVAIRALPELPSHVRFVIFGDGPEEEPLKKLAAELGVSGRVDLRGHIDHRDMPRFLKACDVFVRPSRSEGMGNSFIEAMAAGLPVVGTREGGLADFLVDARDSEREGTGWVAESEDSKAVARAVVHILEHAEEVEAVTRRAQNMVTEKYDWDLVAGAIETKVFKKVLG